MFVAPLKNLLYGPNAGASRRDVEAMSRRNPFSDFLAYRAYDPATETYDNQDDTIGWLWECNPLIFAGDSTVQTLEGLFRAGVPEESVLTLVLHADPYLGEFLQSFHHARVRTHPLVRSYAENLSRYIDEGRYGIDNMAGIPARNFRLLVGIKIPVESKEAQGDGWQDIKGQVGEILSGAGLGIGGKARPMIPERLLAWCRRLFNDESGASVEAWDQNIPLRKQIINAETKIVDNGDHLQIGARYFRCVTPKTNPRTVDPVQVNQLFGGYRGLVCDGDQIKTPFLYTLNIVFQPMKKKLHAKCNFVLQQQAVGSLAPSLQRKQSEYLAATDKIERNIPYLRAMPILWVWGRTNGESMESATKAKRIWEANGFVMQTDRGVLKILLLAALPFGLLLNKGKTLDNLDRDFIVDAEALAPTLPVQGDYRGAGAPKTVLFGRKGQVACLDFWAKGANNRNGLILAESGGGKSFLANDLVFGNYSAGAKIRILDIGYSYRKLVRMLDSVFLDFQPDQPISLNPFTFIIDPAEELSAVVDIFCLMVFAATPTVTPNAIERILVRSAVRFAWDRGKNNADADLVYRFLYEFPRHAAPVVDKETKGNLPLEEEELPLRAVTDTMIDAARHMAFQLTPFTSRGEFGGFFTGPCQFNIRKDDCVVTELQGLRGMPELYRVVVGLVVNAYMQDVYAKKDLSIPTYMLFDEGWQYLDPKQGGAGDLLGPMLEKLVRTIRKQNGGLTVITQSILDLPNFGSAGQALWGNTAFKAFLESKDLVNPEVQKMLAYDDFTMSLLQGIKSTPPRYSEIFLDTPFGRGVARLARDPYNYFINTSEGAEVGAIEALVQKGLSYHEAIQELVAQRSRR